MKEYKFYGWQTADCKPVHWKKEEKRQRYNYLKAEFLKKLETM